ncbi:sel1 repeat family protein [Aminobacter sp. SR38]|uniref:tetratricopeptide repeat protein n=1 Tax=Aminobacter sp. SR38 TaxID=2774562 RepID=UPI00177A90F2|nr:SEL1-like repeat protein [Aminobacter sp. SR38]QOF72461.1 sel1 repeat family protein [Aminobacter sp. SR38]
MAQLKLGFAYLNGDRVSQRSSSAVSWWLKAAEQGDADSQQHLGNAYANGSGVSKEIEAALMRWRKAVEQAMLSPRHV